MRLSRYWRAAHLYELAQLQRSERYFNAYFNLARTICGRPDEKLISDCHCAEVTLKDIPSIV
jgi:hypothetical protein